MRIEAGALLSESCRILGLNWRRVAIAMAILGIPGVLIDLNASEPGRVSSFLSLAALFLQFWLTARLLEDLGKRPRDGGGFGSVFVISLISTIAIILGLLMLIIPGAILLARWSMAVPIAVAEGGGAIAALGESWRRTEGKFWPILIALTLIYIPALALFVLMVELFPASLLVQSLFENVVLNGIFIVGWHASIAFYLATADDQMKLEEVFA